VSEEIAMNGRRSEWSWTLAGLCASALLGGAVAAVAAERTAGDFPAILGEMRNAVAHASDIRAQSDRGGDAIKARCAYEVLRGMMQAVDSTQVSQVAWESARARGDEAAAQAEVARAASALELVRRMRNEADNCVGRDAARAGGAAVTGVTTVTVESTVRDDDPNAGPVEAWAIRPPRLELPVDALPASPFRQTP
jgi:hypothetical protein